MMTQITPDNKEHWLQLRSQDITSTDCAALFGLSKYKTLFELWHEKKENVVYSIEENERMKWGSRLEPVIAQGLADDKGWQIEPKKDYYRIDDLRAGSSFDFFITNENALLEIKNVDGLVYKREWSDDEAPAHIELQVQHQLLVSGLSKAYICALVGGNDVKLIERSRDKKIIDSIIKKIAAFWKSIEENNPPKPDYERDAEFIISQYSFAEPGKLYAGSDLESIKKYVLKYKRAGDLEKRIKSVKDKMKAHILEIIQDSEKVKAEEFSISAGIVGEKSASYTTKPYRDFRVFLKKGKNDE